MVAPAGAVLSVGVAGMDARTTSGTSQAARNRFMVVLAIVRIIS
jgi:hypothetical protein